MLALPGSLCSPTGCATFACTCCGVEIQKAIIEEVVASTLASARDLMGGAVDWVHEKVSGEPRYLGIGPSSVFSSSARTYRAHNKGLTLGFRALNSVPASSPHESHQVVPRSQAFARAVSILMGLQE